MSNIRTNTSVEVRSRVRVLYDVMYQLSKDFGLPENTFEVLRKGIYEEQLIESIEAVYLNDDGEAVGTVEFTVDWEKHEAYAKTSTGKEIRLKRNVSLRSQFADWAVDLVNYVSALKKEFNVTEVEVYYTYTEDVREDCIKREEAKKKLGLVDDDSYNNIRFSSDSREFKRKISAVSQMLPELKISVKSW